jgi:hypothetical protein
LKKGDTRQVSWIPEAFAVEGQHVGIKIDGEWDEGWLVERVGKIRKSEKFVLDHERDHLGHRNRTDV